MRPIDSKPAPDQRTPAAEPADRPAAGPWGFVLAVGVVVAANLLANLLPRFLYVPVNLAMAVVAVLVALGPGRARLDELGLARRDLGSGLRWGAAGAALAAFILTIGVLLPVTRPWFNDGRVNHEATWLVLYTTLVRIPLGTVVLEETVFRGVLLGLGLRRWGAVRATLFSSVLFGLWHVLPAAGLDANPVTDGLSSVITILFAVASTAVVGVVFCWLRLRSRSLLTPMLVHTAFNSIGYLLAWLVLTTG